MEKPKCIILKVQEAHLQRLQADSSYLTFWKKGKCGHSENIKWLPRVRQAAGMNRKITEDFRVVIIRYRIILVIIMADTRCYTVG